MHPPCSTEHLCARTHPLRTPTPVLLSCCSSNAMGAEGAAALAPALGCLAGLTLLDLG
jgi:hypothetical protein